MTAGVAEPSPPLSIMGVPDVEYIVPPPGAEDDLTISSSPRAFKTHKFLPHPRHGSGSGSVNGSLASLESRRSSSGSQSTHTLRHQRRQISGGELPPTPPAHSRTSSSSKSISTTKISPFQTPAQSSEDVQGHVSPSTPPNQRSPPTPEVTPPRSEARSTLAPERPTLTPHRIPSKGTTTDSRTESFRTALESPEPSEEEEEEEEEEDSNPTLRPAPPSARTSQITVRGVAGNESKVQNGLGLVLGVRSKYEHDPHDLTPKATGEFSSFDGEWGVDGEVEQEWDDNLARNVTVKKRRHRSPYESGQGHGVVDDRTVSPTNATKAVRGLPLQGRILTYHSSEATRSVTAPEAITIETPGKPDARRNSTMSSKSTASTIVEAILVETPPASRNRTLRHVKRVDALRDSVWRSSSLNVAPSSESPRPPRRVTRPTEGPRESYASNTTVNSTSSRKARREVWKSGAIPVVVVPDRHSSTRSSSQDRSLRSVSSQRSRRSQSISSVRLSQLPKTQDLSPYFDRPPRRSRRTSESDGSAAGDQRTIDFPPIVPRRTSSLSAPTSRTTSRQASLNGSRAGSLTAESLKAHNESVIANSAAQAASHATAREPSIRTETSAPAVTVSSAPSYFQFKPSESQSEADSHRHRTFDSQLGSPLLPTQTTPFSQVSVETSGTAAEIAQAMAVSIDRHQNRSVLMVDHRPSESSDGETRSHFPGRPDRLDVTTTEFNAPIITTTEFASAEDEPITPPQKQPPFSLNDIESPLRNPRVPPEPPVLQFIPATPSGLTPADERPRLLGNFYDAVEDDETPARGLAAVRKAFTKRRNSYGPSPSRERPGFLKRTLSLNRNIRKDNTEPPDSYEDGHIIYDEPPRDESRLHPDWRPSYNPDCYGDAGDGVYDMGDDGEGEVWRYPMIDNRPKPPKRSLSDRMKHTFAIMPVRSYQDEYAHDNEPERRTIRRDPSGTLRVVKHRGSVGSLRGKKRRPETAPEHQRTPIFPRKYSLAKLRRRGSEDSETESQRLGLRRTWSLTQGMQGLSRRVSERRREKRSDELRKKISAPQDCRDGVENMIRSGGLREDYRTSRKAGVEPEWM